VGLFFVCARYAYIGEMVLKLIGMGFHNFASDKFNLFDAAINLLSITEILIKLIVAGDKGPDINVTVFRVLRLIRVCRALKIVQKWKSMKHILNAVSESGPGLFNFCCLLLLFSFIYSLCGMQARRRRTRCVRCAPSASPYPSSSYPMHGQRVVPWRYMIPVLVCRLLPRVDVRVQA
jgi:hypothetical protein